MLLLRELDARLRNANDVKSPRDEGKVPAIDFEEIDILETKLEPLQPTPVQGDDPPQIALRQFQLESGPPRKAFLKSHMIEDCKEVKLVGEEVGGDVAACIVSVLPEKRLVSIIDRLVWELRRILPCTKRHNSKLAAKFKIK